MDHLLFRVGYGEETKSKVLCKDNWNKMFRPNEIWKIFFFLIKIRKNGVVIKWEKTFLWIKKLNDFISAKNIRKALMPPPPPKWMSHVIINVFYRFIVQLTKHRSALNIFLWSVSPKPLFLVKSIRCAFCSSNVPFLPYLQIMVGHA